MKLSVCTDAVFENRPLREACEEVLRLGYDTIEFWLYKDKDLDELVSIQKETGLKVAAICTDFISLTVPEKREEYRQALSQTIQAAKKLGCKVIISQTGAEEPWSRELQHESIVEGLRSFVPMLEENDVTLAFEPLNIRVDHAGYYLTSSDECAQIIDKVGSKNVKMLFDIYHQQITEGDIIRRIRRYISYIAHFHTAGNPGRHELYNSELDYARVFREIEALGYEGYVGLEYFPTEPIEKGLSHALSIKP